MPCIYCKAHGLSKALSPFERGEGLLSWTSEGGFSGEMQVGAELKNVELTGNLRKKSGHPRQSISLQITEDQDGPFEMRRSSNTGCRLLEGPCSSLLFRNGSGRC